MKQLGINSLLAAHCSLDWQHPQIPTLLALKSILMLMYPVLHKQPTQTWFPYCFPHTCTT